MIKQLIKISVLICFMLHLSSCSSTNATSDASNDEKRKVATAKINTRLGMAYLEQHNIQRAKQKFLTALSEAPNIPETWYSMAYFLEATGDKDQANKHYLKAIEVDATNGSAHNNYGTFLCRSGQYKAAIEQFELAMKDMNYIEGGSAYENAGLCALKTSNKKLALHYLTKSLEQDPDRANVHLELAELNYELGHYQASKQELNQFLKLASASRTSFTLSEKLKAKGITE